MTDSSSPSLFRWTAAYAVGVPQVDEEHQRLFALAERMQRAMLDGKGKPLLKTLLRRLVDYAGYHFAREERLMEQIRYPDFLPHRREHETLRAAVQAMRARNASGEVTMTIEVMQFLMDWLKRHIIANDRRIAAYMETNRLTPPLATAP